MKRRFFLLTFIIYGCLSCYAQQFAYTLDGNAHILPYNDLKEIYESKSSIKKYSANALYLDYNNLRNSCGNNELLFDQKRETEFANRIIIISGYVKQVRKSFLDEYIVELDTTETWAFDIGVVYPKRISNAMLNELLTLKAGDYFETIAVTRNTYMYVDVPVWNSNGTYRTEP